MEFGSSGNVDFRVEIPRFLTLPFKDPDIKIQQGWTYSWGANHKGIDYIKGIVGDSEEIVHSWQEFKVLSVADGEAKYLPDGSQDWGNYVITKHDVNGQTYYAVYAHLSESPLPANEWVPIQKGNEVGTAGDTGDMPDCPKPCIHLHLEVATSWPPQGAKIDPYDIYNTRGYYPGGDIFTDCGPNYLWTTCPPNYSPVAYAGEDQAVYSGDLVTFNGSNSSDPDGEIVSYLWDFDDGETAEGLVVKHRFRGAMNENKTYTVSLTVQDNMGANDTNIVYVTVMPLEKVIRIHPDPSRFRLGEVSVTAFYNWVGVNEDGEDIYVVPRICFQGKEYFSYLVAVVDAYSLPVPTPAWSEVIFGPAWRTVDKNFTYPFGTYRDWSVTFYDEYFEGLAVGPSDLMQVYGFTVQGIPKGIIPSVDGAYSRFEPSSPQVSGSVLELLWASLHSPGELRVYDSLGRVTGLVNGEVKEEIPNSTYFNNTVVILSPTDSYRYEVVGTENGTYGLTITSVEEGNATTFNATDIPTSDNTTHIYTTDWDALSQGEEGVTLQIDSDGDGTFEKTITADNELTQDEFILQTETTIDFNPDTLNLESSGEWITAYIELPEGYNVGDINVSSILLNDTISAELSPTEIGDYDNDSIPDLMVKFNRGDVEDLIHVPTEIVELTLKGTVAGIPFEGNDAIRVIDKGKRGNK